MIDFIHILVHFLYSTLNFHNFRKDQNFFHSEKRKQNLVYSNLIIFKWYFKLSKIKWISFQEESFYKIFFKNKLKKSTTWVL